MTDQEIINYYADLLILQYRGKPKAYATIQAVAKLIIANQILTKIQDAFNIDTAIGVQLDVIGKYVGRSREGYDFSGPVTLDDDDFRKLIRLAIVQNNSGSSLSDIQSLLTLYFEGVIFVFDHLDMRMSYYIDSNEIGIELAEFWVKGNFLPKPMGVQLSVIIYPILTEFFGFRTYTAEAFNATPFNDYDNYDMDRPWLSYDYSVML